MFRRSIASAVLLISSVAALAGPAVADPFVSIATPANGATVTGAVHVRANPSGATAIVRVDFAVDGNVVYRTAGLPYTFGWDTTLLSNGAHRLTVTAVDNSNQAASQSLSVTVANGAAAAVPAGASIVQVVGRQLRVQKRNPNGSLGAAAPYIIKGFTWTATAGAPQRGYNPGDPTNPAGYTDYGYFFDWAGRTPQGHVLMNDWARNRYQGQYAQDAALMQQANANTVRVFNDFGNDPVVTKSILDEFYRRGIMVVLTIVNSQDDITSGRYLQTVNLCKNHPALLMWALGNEWNVNRYYNSFPDAASALAATEQAARQIKQADPNHPVSSSLGDRWTVSSSACGQDDPSSDIPTIVAQAPDVDLWGLNIYRNPTFGDLFTRWQGASAKPLYLSEFGTDALKTTAYDPPAACQALVHVTQASDDAAGQASFDKARWDELKSNLSATNAGGVAVGGFVHEFADQTWKDGDYNVNMGGVVNYNDGILHYQLQDKDGFYVPGTNPDNVFNEEYFGAMTADRTPKPLYTTMQSYFASLGGGSSSGPSAPTGVAATAPSASSIVVTWNSVSGATGYRLDVSASSTFATLVASASNLDVGNVTSRTVTGLSAGTLYYARVRAYDGTAAVSPNSATASAQTPGSGPTPPAAVLWLGLSNPTASSLVLQWQPAQNVSIANFQINVSVSPTFATFVPGYQAKAVPSNLTSWTISGLNASTVYYVNMRSVDGSGTVSSLTDTVNGATLGGATLAPPAGLTAFNVTESGFTTGWSAVAGASGYRMDVSASAAFDTFVSGYGNLDVGNNLSRVVTGLSAGQAYYVRLRAYANGSTSPDSATLTVKTLGGTPDTTPPSPIPWLGLRNVAQTSMQVQWQPATDNVGVAGYRVSVSLSPTFSSFVAGYQDLQVASNLTAWDITGLQPGTPYYVKMRAVDAAGNLSPYTDTVSATTTP